MSESKKKNTGAVTNVASARTETKNLVPKREDKAIVPPPPVEDQAFGVNPDSPHVWDRLTPIERFELLRAYCGFQVCRPEVADALVSRGLVQHTKILGVDFLIVTPQGKAAVKAWASLATEF